MCIFGMQSDAFNGKQGISKPTITIFVFALNLEFLL